MPITNEEIEEQVIKACEELEIQEKPKMAQMARKYGVHKDRIRRRFRGIAGPSYNKGGHNKRLTDDEDKALCLYINFAEEIGLPIREKTLVVAANAILQRHYENPPPVSQVWASRWLFRHPEYKKKTRKPLAAVRKDIHDIEGLNKWFKKLKAVREQYGIIDQDIHNMDETRFRIGVSRQHKVIIKANSARRYLVDPDNQDYITSIESIAADDTTHAPMLVLKASSLLEKWVVNELNNNTALAYSNTGYSNDDINLAWLRHFNKIIRTKIRGLFRLLLLNGFTSHVEYDFIEYAQNNKIILFSFPPHTIHILQPLNVVCFQPFKYYHGKAINTAVQTGDKEFLKVDFLTSFKAFHQQTFKESTVVSAFRKTGIVLYDPSKVLLSLQDKRKSLNVLTGVN